MRRIIQCQVTDEYVRGSGAVVGAAGSHNDVALRLAFNPMWAGTARSIVWKDALGGNPVITILGLDLLEPGETEVYIVPIPAEPKAYAGDMSMTIKGAAVDGDKETSATMTATAFFTVMESDWDEDAEATQDITPTQAEQLQAQLEAVKGDIVTSTQEAAASAEEARNSASDAAGSAKEAEDSKLTAGVCLIHTESYMQKAIAAQAAAEEAAQQAEDSKDAIENMSVTGDSVPADSALPAVVKSENDDGTVNIHINVRQGFSGVYVGSGAMPDGFNVQIDPNGVVSGIPLVDVVTGVSYIVYVSNGKLMMKEEE